MNLIITADNPPDKSAHEWLRDIYIPGVFWEVVPIIAECVDLPVIDPWTAFCGTLTVHLHPDSSWGLAGQYESLNPDEHGFYNPRVNDRIQISWDLESSSWAPPNGQGTRHAVLRHEMQHFLAKQAGLPMDGDFGHGNSNDAYIQALKRKLEFVYHGDVTLRHVRDIQAAL